MRNGRPRGMSAPSTADTTRQTTKAEMRRTLPLGGELPATIARMRQIAARAADTLLLAEGPPDPDGTLLDLCAEALQALVGAEAAYAERSSLASPIEIWSEQHRQRGNELMDDFNRLMGVAKKLLRRATKVRARTPAGIYAKVLCVRASRTGAAELAMSLAEDMIACAALRQTLWPARAEPPTSAPGGAP